VEICDPRIEGLRLDQICRDRGFANALDHRGEGLPGEAVD
jgi:hypothetical protein